MGVMSALICVCSWVTVPLAIPFTLQTFAVFMTMLLLPDARGLASIVVYVLLGALGLPVFSGFTGGIGRLFGPTGGYISGFILLAVFYLLVLKLFGSSAKIKVLGLILGLFVCYAAGTLWFAYFTGKFTAAGFISSLSLCVVPFIIPDLIKLSVALFICKRISRFVTGRRP